MANASFSAELEAGDGRPSGVRHLVVFVTMLAAILLYLDRFCVSFAADYIKEDLNLTQGDMKWFLSAFFWSYALAQVPSGWLSDRFGARLMLVIYILSWSFFTGLIGGVNSLLLLVLTRLGTGLGQAGAYPTSSSVVSKWVPFSSRGSASSVVAFGGRVGGAIAPLLTAYLIVVFVPSDTPTDLKPSDLLHGPRLCAKLSPLEEGSLFQEHTSSSSGSPSEAAIPQAGTGHDRKRQVTTPSPAGRRIASFLSPEVLAAIARPADEFRQWELKQAEWERSRKPGARGVLISAEPVPPQLTADEETSLAAALNQLMRNPAVYGDEEFKAVNLNHEAVSLLKRMRAGEKLSETEIRRFNRFLLEGTYRGEVGKLYVRGWRPVMYVYGLAGLFVAGLFWIFFRNRPDEHPWCNAEEQALIAAGRPVGAPSPHGKAGMVPMGPLLKSRSMWLICFSQVGTNIGWVFLVTWLPRYLVDVHDVPILQRGFMASIPLSVGIVGMLAGGRFTDALVGKMGLKWGRRLPMLITRFTAAMGYLICLVIAAFPESPLSSPWTFVAAFSLVAFSVDLGTGAAWAFTQDVGGRYVGSVLGWGNMWGNLGAACSPPIYDYFLGEHPTLGDWDMMFAVCLAAFVMSGVCVLGVDASVPIAPADEDDGG